MNPKTYVIKKENKEDFRVCNQTYLKQAIIDEPKHNACWDANLHKDGTLYFSVCSEHTNHEYAKLYKYEFESNKATECFYTKDFLLKSDRYLRDSKFHTSIHFKPDGKLIMVTHSTDKSPCHPVWLPYSFVSNPWEGFPGGELMEYDPATGKVELLGIPAPRESIYGAVYSPKDDAYYMLGWIRGHLYRYDCKERKCKDLGQVSEYRSYRIVLGPDENLYFSTKSGYLMRYNVDKQKIENLNFRLPCDKTEKGRTLAYTYMGPCVTGPDGRLYTTGNNTSILTAYDVNTDKGEIVGDLIPADDYIDIDDGHTFVAGMDFDKYGVLWYSTMTFRKMEDEHYKAPSGLLRWDIMNGKKPEFLGLFGTPERVQTYTDSLFVDKERDILYSASTNHSFGSPDIIAIDLKEFRNVMYEKGPISEDMLAQYPAHPDYHEFAEHWQNVKILIAEYAANVQAKSIIPTRLWTEFDDDNIKDAYVRTIRFKDNDTVEGICGIDILYRFTISDGKIISLTKTDNTDALLKNEVSTIDESILPHYPGRQWRRSVTCECDWTNGAKIVGTQDGFLAKINSDGSVYSIGPAICQGPVRDICSDLNTGVLYGVGGDEEDIGNVFKYTDKEGLKYLGYMNCDRIDDNAGTCANFILTSIAISPDGKKIAVGSGDRLSTVYILEM